MPRSKTLITLVIVVLLVITILILPVRADQAGAATAISSAKNTILGCYSAAKEAEAAGANITVLIGTLNEAGSLISQAELAYSTNNFDTAVSFAVQSQNTLSNFIGEANSLEETATQQQSQDFLINVIGSIIGTIAVVIAGFLVWRFLKNKYETVGSARQ